VYFISLMLKSEGEELEASKSTNCIYLVFLFLLMKLLVQQFLALLNISPLTIKKNPTPLYLFFIIGKCMPRKTLDIFVGFCC